MLKKISERFNAYGQNFFAVIAPDGKWVDSATSFTTAVHWAVMDAGHETQLSVEEELALFNTLNYSIVCKEHLQTMIDAGVVS